MNRFGLPWGTISSWRSHGLRIVATDGCFDLVHVGHLRLLEWAASCGDKLVVLIPDDAGIASAKGVGRPYTSLEDRAEMLAGLKPVDAVGRVMGYGRDGELVEAYAALRPNIMVNSPEWKGRIVGQAEVEAAGGEIAYFPTIPGYSTSELVSKIRDW